MNKSLLALAVLTAFTASATAQSVAVTGRLNSSVGKPVGTKVKQVMDITNSLLAFSVTEPLSPRLLAFGGFEHRFGSDTGTDLSGTNTFWNGYSYIGLRDNTFGVLMLGRYYTAAFMGAQDRFDPFAGDTVAGLRAVLTPFSFPLGTNGAALGSGAIPRARTPNIIYWSLRPYAWTLKGTGFDAKFSVGAERAAPGVKRAWSAAVAYQNEDLYIGLGHEDPEGKRDRLTTLGVNYDLKVVKLTAAASVGQDNSLFTTTPARADPSADPKKYRGWMVGGSAPLGPGLLMFGYGESKIQNNTRNGYVDIMAKVGVGYRYYLSKKTWIYTDVGYDRKQRGPNPALPNVNSEKFGYDLGLTTYF